MLRYIEAMARPDELPEDIRRAIDEMLWQEVGNYGLHKVTAKPGEDHDGDPVIWVEADYYATFNIADLTFEPGYYMVFVSYAQWNGYDYDYSGEYINSYDQYYSYSDHETSDFCYLGNDLSQDS